MEIFTHELREKAGSESYNRFEYQVHWIVYHMINEYKSGKNDYLIICEFHDDMAKFDCRDNPSCVEFFQVKTSSRYKNWSISKLSNKTKKKQHSFLGFLFMNFLNFDKECSQCHFVSNIDIDEDIRKWQAIIEDGGMLKDEAPNLYQSIRQVIKDEYLILSDKKFDEVYDIFIQNTYVYFGQLPLGSYEKVVMGEFFDLLKDKDIYTSNCNKILNDLIQDVRKKSKKTINTPISFTRLKKVKGVNSSILDNIKNSISIRKRDEIYRDLEDYLLYVGNDRPRAKLIIRTLKKHHEKLLDVSNYLYKDLTLETNKVIDAVTIKFNERLEDRNFIIQKIKEELEMKIEKEETFEDFLLEVLFYERLFE